MHLWATDVPLADPPSSDVDENGTVILNLYPVAERCTSPRPHQAHKMPDWGTCGREQQVRGCQATRLPGCLGNGRRAACTGYDITSHALRLELTKGAEAVRGPYMTFPCFPASLRLISRAHLVAPTAFALLVAHVTLRRHQGLHPLPSGPLRPRSRLLTPPPCTVLCTSPSCASVLNVRYRA